MGRSRMAGNLLIGGMLVGVVAGILLPWLAVTFVPSDWGMVVTMLMFFVVNPIAFIAVGAMAAADVRMLWPVPLVDAFLYVFGAHIYFGAGGMDSVFLIYAASYLAVSYFAMATVNYVRKKKSSRR